MKKNKFLSGGFLTSLLIVFSFVAFAPIVGAEDLDALRQLSNAFASISDKVSPSVVSVVATTKIKVSQPGISPFDDPFFDELRRFFGPDFSPRGNSPQEREYEQSGMGSGVIITTDGYILTNNHVVAPNGKVADKIKVIVSDDKEFDAEIKGRDTETDIAVIKIDAKNLPAAKIGDSDKVKVGEWVLAIGSPFGLQHTVTAGIISAISRTNMGITQYEDFIQTDAAINPGNSGGPLVNLDGEVIGINTFIFSRTGGYMGVGFAIPINMAQKVMEQLISKGKIVRGWLGVTIQDLTEELAGTIGLKQTKGVVVRQVQIGSPADKAGIKSNDIILKIDGKPMETTKQLMQFIAGVTPGTEIAITVLRADKEVVQKAKITEKQPLGTASAADNSTESQEKLGLEIRELDDELATQYHLQGEKGVVVTKVTPGSLAERAELQEGDLIIGINGRTIGNIEDYRKAVDKIGEQNNIEFSCIRYYMGNKWRFTTRVPLK
ncbi:MAG: DegQ family serine endoprotease [Candidatus Ratteibacteria bacterium]|nr:DegQ family serine endoprotease [Candidatus Ratteibacteria bacterium]